MTDFDREAETGMPFLQGAQRSIARTTMVQDDDGQVVTETLVLPNFIFFLYPDEHGVRAGHSVMVSPQYARQFVEALPDLIEHVNKCDCRMHAGRSMEFVSLD